MDVNEAAAILRMKREEVKTAIKDGIQLPQSKKLCKLEAHTINEEYDIDEDKLDEFIKSFEAEEPGRHPPTAVCRELLVEARHRCAICEEQGPIEYHHIIEFSTLKHYDTKHMLALCPTCHAKCTFGEIDQKAQRLYKEKLKQNNGGNSLTKRTSFLDENGPVHFSWEDLKELITALHGTITSSQHSDASKYDYTNIDIQSKNRLNNLGEDYFQIIVSEHEPFFHIILEFLNNPINSDVANLYYEVIDELRTKIAADRERWDRFEHILVRFADAATQNDPGRFKGKRRVLNILLSFMYVNCDIGRKA